MTTAATPTIIDIDLMVPGLNDNTNDPYYLRSDLDYRIVSTNDYDPIAVSHLGFRAYEPDKKLIVLENTRYRFNGFLEANTSAMLSVKPFQLCLVNIGDSFMRVNVRLQDSKEHCKVTILQEKYQVKTPKAVDEFIEFENVWYATAIINCLQTLRIEEI